MGRDFSRIITVMTLVRMLWDMQGGRYDGQAWPGYLKEIDVPEWEAVDLVSNGTAEYTTAPVLDRGFDVLKVADPNFEKRLKVLGGEEPAAISDNTDDAGPVLVDSDDDFDNDFEDTDDDNEVGVTPQVKRPSTIDSKAAWVDYAVAKGANREKAAAKTKAILISEYGKL